MYQFVKNFIQQFKYYSPWTLYLVFFLGIDQTWFVLSFGYCIAICISSSKFFMFDNQNIKARSRTLLQFFLGIDQTRLLLILVIVSPFVLLHQKFLHLTIKMLGSLDVTPEFQFYGFQSKKYYFLKKSLNMPAIIQRQVQSPCFCPFPLRVGIKGLEGQQAARASDYAVGNFKSLRKLTLFYGRESYRKNSALICYNFYKNMLLVIPQLVIGFYNGFSAQNMFDPFIFQLYNVIFTSLPIVVYALCDEELSSQTLLTQADIYYLQGPNDKLYNTVVFWTHIITGMVESFLFTLPAFWILGYNFTDPYKGYIQSFWTVGMVVLGMIVVVANLKILLISNSHSYFSLTIIFLSVFLYYVLYCLQSGFMPSSDSYNTSSVLLRSPYFYLCFLIQVGFTSLIEYAFCCYQYEEKREFQSQALQQLFHQEANINQNDLISENIQKSNNELIKETIQTINIPNHVYQ